MTKTKLGLPIAAMAAILGGAAAIQSAAAQEPGDTVNVDVGECVKLTTPEERLACFEKQVEGARTNPTPAGAQAAPSGAPPPVRGGDQRETPPDILARVVELRETVPNSYLITLDNGQVWRQTVPKAYALRPGYEVRIYYSKWRTYRLTNEQLRSFIQVERVR